MKTRKSKSRFSVAIVATATFLCLHCIAGVAQSSNIQTVVNIEQFSSTTGGDPTFEIDLSSLSFFAQTAVGPDGTNYTSAQMRTNSPTFATFSDMSSDLFGTWTFVDMASSTQYQFTVSSFSLDSVFHDIPQITSPLGGSQVTSPFTVAWSYLGGETRSQQNLRAMGGVSIGFPSGQPIFTLLVPAPAPVTVWAGTSTPIASHFSSVTPTGAAGVNTYSFLSDFIDLSAPVTFTVVPEPSSIVLAALGFVGLVGIWRKGRAAPK